MAGGAYRLDEVAVRLDGGAGGTDVPLPVAVASGGTGADLSSIAKGGLLVGTAAGTIGLKAVGTNTQVLTADDTADGGVKWAAAGGISGLTTGTVPKAASATTLTNSSVTDNGTTLTLGNAGVTVTEATGAVSLTAQAVGTTPLAVAGATGQTASLLTVTGGATPGASYAPMVSVTGTLPASPSAEVSGVTIAVTGAGSAAYAQSAFSARLLAGFTGAGVYTYGGLFENAGLAGARSSVGVKGLSTAGGSSSGIGAYGVANVYPASVGVQGDSAGSGGWYSAGVHGRGYGGTPIGGWFLLHSGTTIGAFETTGYASAALLADNRDVAAPIILAKDNTTTVFSVEDGGYLTGATGGVAGTAAWGVPAAAPQAYTHTLAASSRAGTDTNTRGAKATLLPGLGTGTGGSGDLAIQTAYPGTTGTTANTPTDRTYLGSLWTTLTAASDDNFATLTYAASTAVGAEFLITVEANDGTEYQALTSVVRVSSVRKATGNTVSSIAKAAADVLATSSVGATLTADYTVTEGAGAVTINCNAVSSLTETTLRLSFQARANGPVTIAQIP